VLPTADPLDRTGPINLVDRPSVNRDQSPHHPINRNPSASGLSIPFFQPDIPFALKHAVQTPAVTILKTQDSPHITVVHLLAPDGDPVSIGDQGGHASASGDQPQLPPGCPQHGKRGNRMTCREVDPEGAMRLTHR
jgi:hypothetical protein